MTGALIIAGMRTALIACVLALAFGGCGGSGDGDDDEFPRVITLGEGEIFPSILNSALGPGENRVSLSLTGADDAPLFGADVHLRVFDLNGDDPRQTLEADARFVPIELGYVDEQSDGSPRESSGDGGAYIAIVSFDDAGRYGLKIGVTHEGREYDEILFQFDVQERTREPAIGEEAPRSIQPTLATMPDIEEIDSSSPPRPAMHDLTIADAIAAGKPTVIAFATPAYCRSRTCAPVMDTVMDPLHVEFGERASFIHVEPYVLRDLRAGFVQNAVPATREWNLQSEPWIFVVGADGRIAGKFEGIVGPDEVRTVLEQALAAD